MAKKKEELFLQIEKGAPASFYLIYGNDHYRVKEATRKLTDLLLADGDRQLNCFVYDGEKIGIDEVCDTLMTPPLFSGRKVVVLRNSSVFHSRATSPSFAVEAMENLEKNPARSARAFKSLLELSGLSLDDVRDGGWKCISEIDWKSFLGEEAARKRAEWLDKAAAVLAAHGNAGGSPVSDTSRLEEILEGDIPEGNHLIISAETVDRRKKIFKMMMEKGEALSFDKEKNERSQNSRNMDEVRQYLSEKGKEISQEALKILCERAGSSLASVMSEVDKVVSFVAEKRSIEKDDIASVIGPESEAPLYRLTGAIREGYCGKALGIFANLKVHEIHPLAVVATLTKEVRFLVQANIFLSSTGGEGFNAQMGYRTFQEKLYPHLKKLSGHAAGTGWLVQQHPYVIFNALRDAKRLPLKRLHALMERIVEVDSMLKSSGRDPESTVRVLIIEMCQLFK